MLNTLSTLHTPCTPPRVRNITGSAGTAARIAADLKPGGVSSWSACVTRTDTIRAPAVWPQWPMATVK